LGWRPSTAAGQWSSATRQWAPPTTG
jgi:hypothetical protein